MIHFAARRASASLAGFQAEQDGYIVFDSVMPKLLRPIDRAFYYGTGEWLLEFQPNGGTVITLRSLKTAILLYGIALAIRHWLDPCQWHLLIVETMPWLGAIFAAAYAALYARFSSQWSYLSDVYNQIKAAECSESKAPALAEWKAAFIEDALELHLAYKPVFAAVIYVWGQDQEVRTAFVRYAPGGVTRYALVMKGVSKVTRKRRWRSKATTRAARRWS